MRWFWVKRGHAQPVHDGVLLSYKCLFPSDFSRLYTCAVLISKTNMYISLWFLVVVCENHVPEVQEEASVLSFESSCMRTWKPWCVYSTVQHMVIYMCFQRCKQMWNLGQFSCFTVKHLRDKWGPMSNPMVCYGKWYFKKIVSDSNIKAILVVLNQN